MKKEILVVDNHPMILQFVTDILEQEGCTVRTAGDGLSALELLKGFTPDAAFVDLVMPNISGEMLCRIIRRMPHLQHIPLIVLSAIAAEEELCVTDFGATLCIAKGPMEKMGEHIRDVLSEIEQGNIEMLAGQTIGLNGVYVRKISEELLSSKRHAEAILQNLSEGILELTMGGKIIFANKAALNLIGTSEEQVLAAEFAGLFDGGDQERVKRLLAAVTEEPQVVPQEDPVLLSGRYFSLNLIEVRDSSHQTIIVIIDDVTEHRRMAAQVRRAREAEAILAGAVAHDLNNILGGIVGYPDLLLLKLPENSELTSAVMKIQDAGRKAAAVVQDLLSLGRCGHLSMAVLDLNRVVSDYLVSAEHESLTRQHPEVQLVADLDSQPLYVEGSAVHLSKALMNLVYNAAEAVDGSGRVRITTGTQEVKTPLKGFESIPKGSYVKVVVTDTGEGMTGETIDRIFEPFYSRKVLGRSGTGLGMAVVRTTVKAHAGFIDVESTVGSGSTITLFLPVAGRLPRDQGLVPEQADYQGRGESILVVDDVREQREIATTMLGELGYQVEAVASGEEAVRCLQKGRVDLIVLDMIMDPGIDGLETYRRIIELHPGQRAIIVSGFSETDRVREAQQLGAGAYVRKPFMLEKLGLAVRRELDRGATDET
jgi:PAS domain S-box-containing protein